MKTIRPKVMMHIVRSGLIGGPSTQTRIILDSYLNSHYNFGYLEQRGLAGGRFKFSIIVNFLKQLKKFKPDIVHVSGLQVSAFYAVVAARLLGFKKVIVVIRGSANDSLTESKINRIIIGKILEPLTLMLCHRFYTVCHAMANRTFIKAHKNKFYGTIHNAAGSISDKTFKSKGFRVAYNIGNNEIVVAVVGRIVIDKGIEYIARAIRQISRNNQIKFVFIGDGSSKIYLEEQLASEIKDNRVILMGKRDDPVEIMVECDIFLFATLHENLSNALLEACSLGLGIIASNVGGNPEVVKHNFNGLIIPPQNTKAIVDSVLYLSTNHELRSRLGDNAILTVEKNFSQKTVMKKLDNLYREVLKNSR